MTSQHAFRFIVLLAIAGLAACGGGGGAAVSPTAGSSPSTTGSGPGNVVTLQVATGSSSSSAARSPAYVSASALGLQIVITSAAPTPTPSPTPTAPTPSPTPTATPSGSTTTAVSPTLNATVYDVSIAAGSPLCSSGSCSIPVPVVPGYATTFSITEVDQQPDNSAATGFGTGFTTTTPHALAVGSTTVTPAANSRNAVAVVLDPIAANLAVAVSGAVNGGGTRYIVTADGTAQPLTLSITPQDYDDNTIAANGQPFVSQAGVPTAITVTIPTTPDLTAPGVSPGTLTFANSTSAGTIFSANATYDGVGTSAIVISASNGLSNNPSSLFGGTYASAPAITFAPLSISATLLEDVSGSSDTVTVTEPGEPTGFTASTCLDVNGNPVATVSAATPYSAGMQQFTIQRVHPGACNAVFTDSYGVSIGVAVASVGSIPIPFHIPGGGETDFK